MPNYRIKIVDGYKIRNTVDIDFGCIEDRITCPYIPKNEIWIDSSYKKERKAILTNFLKKRSLIKKFGYEKAKKMMRQKQRAINEPAFKIAMLGKFGHIKIWLISGKIIRKFFDSNFYFGGHDLVYDYIPANEIWLDDTALTKELKYVLIHELFERNLMKKGKDYDNAHDYASTREKEARRFDKVAKYLKD